MWDVSLWVAVFVLAYVHCPFLQRTGKVAWAVAGALFALVQVAIRHQVCRIKCRYNKFMHPPVEAAANPKNKPAPNVVMRRPGATKVDTGVQAATEAVSAAVAASATEPASVPTTDPTLLAEPAPAAE